MITPEMKELLNDSRVVEEVNKHRWYESEKKKMDVGFEYAFEDWHRKYALNWMKEHVSLGKIETITEKIRKVFGRRIV